MKLQTFLFLFFCACPLFADCVSGSSVPEEGLVAYYPFDGDAVSRGSVAGVDGEVYRATLATDRFGKSNSAYRFGGSDSAYIEIPDNDIFSIATTGALTVSAWISPDSLDFERTDGGYVHWMGKGEPHAHEWALRMYNFRSERPNRISSYAFNLSGGLGAGSYVQEEVVLGEWIHIVARYDMESNTITIFKNGAQKDQDPLYDDTYKVIPENGNAPVRIGTRSLWSFFRGKIDDVRFYDRAVSDGEVLALYRECPDEATALPSKKKSLGLRIRSGIVARGGKVCAVTGDSLDSGFSLNGQKGRCGR